MRQVERDQSRFRVCSLQKMAQDLPCARSHIQYAATAGNVEPAATEHPSDKRFMQRHQASNNQHGPGRSVIQMPDAIAVRASMEFTEFDQPAQGFFR